MWQRLGCWLTVIFVGLSPTLWGITSTEIVAFHQFEGDRRGDFAGDLVVTLADGSAWKVHPEQEESFDTWKAGDAVHISLRTSQYWFRRHHKFFLNNLDRKECLKVMLVGYGDSPLTVVNASDVYDWDTGEDERICYEDSDGIQSCRSQRKYVKAIDVSLSDGTSWVVFKHFIPFRLGAKVYLGFNRYKSGVQHFLITRDQREAVWSYIEAL